MAKQLDISLEIGLEETELNAALIGPGLIRWISSRALELLFGAMVIAITSRQLQLYEDSNSVDLILTGLFICLMFYLMSGYFFVTIIGLFLSSVLVRALFLSVGFIISNAIFAFLSGSDFTSLHWYLICVGVIFVFSIELVVSKFAARYR